MIRFFVRKKEEKFEIGGSQPCNSICLKNGGYVKGIAHKNTFKVVKKHEKVTDQVTGVVTGVSFNVERLPKPMKKHRNQKVVDRGQSIESYKIRSAEFYNQEAQANLHEAKDMRIEAAATHDDGTGKLIHVGGNGFLFATVSAFAYHLPLTLAPDHIWMLINYAFAKHVEQNAEELRKNFVQHDGKNRLSVDTGAGFLMSRDGNPDTGASAEEWESIVFASFSRQIKARIGEKTHSTIAADFSTTTKAHRAATEITLMAAMKSFFSYGVQTKCGIPKVSLLGTEEDWVKLRERAEALGPLMKPEFSEEWMPFLLPVLDEFVESYRGNVNHSFWQTMVKLRETKGSGAHSFISGWMQVLFPILANGEMNPDLRPWRDMHFSGPRPEEFPDVVSAAPADWSYHGATFDLDFHAGMMGCSQDGATGALTPGIGWFVSHAPGQPPGVRLAKVKTELEGLLLGHGEGHGADGIDEANPGYHRRVLVLEREKAELERRLATSSSSG